MSFQNIIFWCNCFGSHGIFRLLMDLRPLAIYSLPIVLSLVILLGRSRRAQTESPSPLLKIYLSKPMKHAVPPFYLTLALHSALKICQHGSFHSAIIYISAMKAITQALIHHSINTQPERFCFVLFVA